MSEQQARTIAYSMFTRRLDRALRRAAPEFAELGGPSRDAFLLDCLHGAVASGLSSEQGVVAYTLAAWFFGPGFEERSRALAALLGSGFPEARKVHAMNEWVQALLGDPEDTAAADTALRLSFHRTCARRRRAGGR